MKALAALALALVSSAAQASNYPPDYAYQTVRTISSGAVLFAHVGSGILSQEVVGYKGRGPLAQGNPESLSAVVTTSCAKADHSVVTLTQTLKLGREWNGTGYMSAPFSAYQLLPQGCSPSGNQVYEFAFSDDHGGWDAWSDGHKNYYFSYNALFGMEASPVVFQTNEGGTEINLKAWGFIVDQMRR